MFNLYENIIKVSYLSLNREPVGLRVRCDRKGTKFVYDVGKYTLVNSFGEDIFKKLKKVLHTSVYHSLYLTYDESTGIYRTSNEIASNLQILQVIEIPDDLSRFLAKVDTIYNQKNGNGDTDVVAVASSIDFATKNWGYQPGGEFKYVPFQGSWSMKEMNGVNIQLSGECLVVSLLPEKVTVGGVNLRDTEIMFRLKPASAVKAYKTVEQGKALLDFSFCILDDADTYEYGCRTAYVGDPAVNGSVDYIKLVNLK